MSEKFTFTEPFRSQLIRALEGYSPPTPKDVFVQKAMQKQMPTVAQLAYLKKLGVEIAPNSKWEASKLIDEALNK